jgi:hypothetical protein
MGTEKTSESAAVDAVVTQRVDWWLAEINQHGYVSDLCDGPHSDRAGVEKALYLFRGMGLERDRRFCCVRVEQSEVVAVAHDVNHEALADCRMMIDRASSG